jgi:hypothetical protein
VSERVRKRDLPVAEFAGPSHVHSLIRRVDELRRLKNDYERAGGLVVRNRVDAELAANWEADVRQGGRVWRESVSIPHGASAIIPRAA